MVRSWVLTVPHRLRHRLAFDHALCRAVLGVFVLVCSVGTAAAPGAPGSATGRAAQ